jgi:Uncharacterized lipoprotein
MRIGLFVILLALSAAAASGTPLLEHVPLQWRPTSELQLGARTMSGASIRFETFQDVRDNKAAIGENLEEEDKPKPVTTSEDVGAFVSRHMRELFDQAGLKTTEGDADVTIRGEVKQFFVRETNTYRSELAVHITVVGRSGKTLWNGVATGDAARFGRSYKLENYQETLSDAIVNTVSSMLQSTEFQTALSGG